MLKGQYKSFSFFAAEYENTIIIHYHYRQPHLRSTSREYTSTSPEIELEDYKTLKPTDEGTHYYHLLGIEGGVLNDH